MDQMTRQTETNVIKPENNTARRIVGVLFAVVEIILGLRLVFTFLGANADNGFIKAVHTITQFFVGIFEGIFARISINEASHAVFEPATLIAMILVALVGWVVLKLMALRRSRSNVERIEYVSTAIPAIMQNTDEKRQA